LEYEKIDGATFEKLMKGELEFTPNPEKQKTATEVAAEQQTEEKKEENSLDTASKEAQEFFQPRNDETSES